MFIESYIAEITGQKACGDIAGEALKRTAHLVKARSVAYGAAFCIFAARLAEAMGVRGFFQSILPGKGNLVHQLLAIAFPQMFVEHRGEIASGDFGAIKCKEYVDYAENLLKQLGVPALEMAETRTIHQAKDEATTMLREAISFLHHISGSLGIDLWERETRVFSEFQLMSYRVHVWGIIDALIEDPVHRRAVIIDWKSTTEDSRAPQIGGWEIAQAYVYALLEADRLNFDDILHPVLEGNILPVIIRPRGDIRVYSISPSYRTSSSKVDLGDLLRKIMLSAEHLTLTVTDVGKLVGSNYERICRVHSSRSGRLISAFRRVPPDLPRGNPISRQDSWPCVACSMREECRFYIYSSEQPEEIDRIAWRTRFSIYSIRENALQPYKELHDSIGVRGFTEDIFREGRLRVLEGGNRIDVFDEAEAPGDSIILKRDIRPEERAQERILTVRDGKPVALFFNEPSIPDPLLRLALIGRVEETGIDEEDRRAFVRVEAPNAPSRIHHMLFKLYFRQWGSLSARAIAVETNVDLTQLELRAVDAYQRATKYARKRGYTDLAEELNKKGRDFEQESLAQLFGSSFWWRVP